MRRTRAYVNGAGPALLMLCHGLVRCIRTSLIVALAGFGCDGNVAGADEPHHPSASARFGARPVRVPLNAPDVSRLDVSGPDAPPSRHLAAVDAHTLCVTKGKLDRANAARGMDNASVLDVQHEHAPKAKDARAKPGRLEEAASADTPPSGTSAEPGITSISPVATRIEVPTFRAVAQGRNGDAAAIKLTVLGDTAKTRALKSGQQRRQVGLKLRAENGCNLVYVMWRLDPKPKLDVSVKRNPGERTAKECGADGYQKVKPTFKRFDTTLDDGAPHELRAEIVDDTLTAWIDGRVAWRGTLPATARDLVGPAGIRSDNLAFELASLEVDAQPTSGAGKAPKCVDEEGDPAAAETVER